MISSIKTIFSSGTDPYRNIALEEFLLRHETPGEAVLYLWQNRRTVVIGRNQNARRECRTEELSRGGGFLARRLSGGGAVYHDLGNLNFTFLARGADYDLEKQLSVILRAVRALGADAEKDGRNDLTVSGRKFSGCAFYRSGELRYHHGTLLVSADLNDLSRYLNPDPEKLAGRGVRSVRARVGNLAEFCPGLTVSELSRALVQSFGEVYGLTPERLVLSAQELCEAERRAEFFASPEWLYGAEPPAASALSRRFPWGGLELRFETDRGRLRRVRLYSDGMDADFLAALPSSLEGCSDAPEALSSRIAAIPCETELQKQMLDGLLALLSGARAETEES